MVYQQSVRDVHQITRRLIDSWSSLWRMVIDHKIDHWQHRRALPMMFRLNVRGENDDV